MKLLQHQPKVIEIALTRRNIEALQGILEHPSRPDYMATLDEDSGWLVKITVVRDAMPDHKNYDHSSDYAGLS